MRINRRFFSLVLAFMLAASMAGGTENADEVTPELAKKAAVYILFSHPPQNIREYKQLTLLGPKKFYNYERTSKYYVFVFYYGPGDEPTWDDITNPKRRSYFNEYYAITVTIPASKDELPLQPGWGGFPRIITSRETAMGVLTAQFPGEEIEYQRSIIEGWEIFDVFIVGGREKLYYGLNGVVINPNKRFGKHCPPDPRRYTEMVEVFWKEVNAFSISGLPE